jgi:hypothetical protein
VHRVHEADLATFGSRACCANCRRERSGIRRDEYRQREELSFKRTLSSPASTSLGIPSEQLCVDLLGLAAPSSYSWKRKAGAAAMRATENIELFNRAFALAWCQITLPPDPKASFDLGERIAVLVRAEIIEGTEDAQEIADAAIAQLKK